MANMSGPKISDFSEFVFVSLSVGKLPRENGWTLNPQAEIEGAIQSSMYWFTMALNQSLQLYISLDIM